MAQTRFPEERFAAELPKRKIGMLLPLPVVETATYEFYRIVRDPIILVHTAGSISEFSTPDIERVIAAFDADVEKLVRREVDIIVQAGVPLPTIIGVEAHDRVIAHIARVAGKPATSQINNIVAALRHLGLAKVAVANKWTPEMNRVLSQFFARAGAGIAGVTSEVMGPDEFTRVSSRDHMAQAYALGRRALEDHPEADGLYLGGGSWLSEPVAVALEEDFGKPVVTNLQAMIWDVFHVLGVWKPIQDHGKLLASD